MSSKHLRRLLEAEDKKKVENQELEDSEDGEEETRPAVNRFAFLEDNSDLEERDSGDELFTEQKLVKKANNAKQAAKKNKKKNKKAKKVLDSDDEDALLEKLAKENAERTGQSTSGEPLFSSLEPVFKVDPKKFDPRAELKAALGKAFKDVSGAQTKGREAAKTAGRIVKCDRRWPPVRNIGLSMVPANEAKTEFKYTFNKHYEMLERMALLGEQSMDISTAHELLQSEHWHLHSILLLANASLMQEDITNAMDLVERGIFFCEQNFHSMYDYTNLNHHLKYREYENRAFYLLLHKYVLMCIQKRCFETALNFAKLICSLDIENDPLAMFLMLDTLAIKAKKHDWLNLLSRAYSDNRKMSLLPNFSYSTALSAFLTATTDQQKEDASLMLEDAIHRFPGVVTHLIDVLQIQADSAVESNAYLSTFAFSREQEGFQLVTKIYIHQSQELWKASDVLLWLENVSRKVATESSVSGKKIAHKMESWKAKRSRMFVGIPEEVKRLAVLLGLSHEGKSVTDPIPPGGSANKYSTTAPMVPLDEGMLAGFFNSILPDYDPSIPLYERIQNLGLGGDAILQRLTEMLRPQPDEGNQENQQ